MADSLILSPSYRLHIHRGDGRTRTGDRGFADPCLIHLGYVALRNELFFEPFSLPIIPTIGPDLHNRVEIAQNSARLSGK